MSEFAPEQIILGAAYLEGRRLREDRIRANKIAAIDAAVARFTTLLDQASATLASTPDNYVRGVLPWDPQGYYTADQTLIPDQEAIDAFTLLAREITWEGRHRDDPDAALTRLSSLFVRIQTSAAQRRSDIVA
jgi:hypothetical protein